MATFLVVCLTTLIASVYSFSHGAPSELCGSPLGRPVHNDTLPQSSCSPYVLEVNSTLYSPNQPINVTIHGNGTPFKGFMLTADTTTGLFDGTCLNTSTASKAVPHCGMTHTDSSLKTSVTLLWYPPSLIHVGNIQFKLVAVQNFTTFWSDIRSTVIKPNSANYYSLRDIWALGFLNNGRNNQRSTQMSGPALSMGSLGITNNGMSSRSNHGMGGLSNNGMGSVSNQDMGSVSNHNKGQSNTGQSNKDQSNNGQRAANLFGGRSLA